MMSIRNIVLALVVLVIRLFNSLTIKTFFQPDEYWQALEPAHRAVYGYGYVTWEWREGIRSAIIPLIYGAVYRLGEKLGVDVVIMPKIFQAVLAAVGDLYTAKLAAKLVNKNAGKWALALSIFSAFNWFCICRTFSNSLETVLTTIALYYWPRPGPAGSPMLSYRSYVTSLVIASIACICRPTNGVIWMVLGLHLVWKTRSIRVLAVGLIVLSATLGLGSIVDQKFYGRSVIPLVNFIKFNVVESLSHFYGVSPWHYYLSQGLPLLLIGYLPLTLVGIWRNRRSVYTITIVTVITVYSLLRHKEVRFIFPLLPLLHVVAASELCRFRSARKARLAFLAMALINLPVIWFSTYVHQRGVIDVISFIRDNEPKSIDSVGFLMPCHSTPWQSHMHRPELMQPPSSSWFLTCEPPIGLTAQERLGYMDEADVFYDDIAKFIDERFSKSVRDEWPSHVVFFEASEPEIAEALKGKYQPFKRFFNSYFHDDWRRKGDVVMYERSS